MVRKEQLPKEDLGAITVESMEEERGRATGGGGEGTGDGRKESSKEIAMNEGAPSALDHHGGWNDSNSKAGLDLFLQMTGQKTGKRRLPVFSTVSNSNNLKYKYTSSIAVFVPQLERGLLVRGQGDLRRESEEKCALAALRQLYQMGIVGEFEEGGRMEMKEESMPARTKGYGSRYRDLSKQGIDLYLQKAGLPPLGFQTRRKTNTKGNIKFISEASVFVPEIGQNVTGEGKARTLEGADFKCAEKIACQLYDLGVMDSLQKEPVEEGKENVIKSEPAGNKADCGGWNEKNSREALNKYLQKTAAYITSEQTTAERVNLYFSTAYIFVPERREFEGGAGSGRSAEEAERKCAASIVQKLYRMKILEEFEESAKDSDEKAINLESRIETLEIASDHDELEDNSVDGVPIPIPGSSVEAQSAQPKKSATGGWSQGNSKDGLDEFLKGKDLPPAQYKTGLSEKAMKKKNKKPLYVSILSLLIPEIGEEVTVKGIHLIAKKAEAICAMRMARRLYQMDVLEEIEKKNRDGVVKNGGWGQRNCQQGLEEFLEETEQPPVVYECVQKNIKKEILFVCTASVHAAGKTVSGSGEMWTEVEAQRACAEEIVIQLYEMKALSEFQSQKTGGWNLYNSKQKLDEFLEERELDPVVYSCQKIERKHVCTTSVFIPTLPLTGVGRSCRKENAVGDCAHEIVHMLYNKKLIDEFQPKYLPPIPVSLPEKLVARVKSYIRLQGVTPVVPTPEAASSTDPQSLILSSHRPFAQFPTSKISRPRMIPWSPPMPNWNPWKGCEIGQEPWASKTVPQMSQFIEKMEADKVPNDAVYVLRRNLPVTSYRQQIIDTVAANQVTLIKGSSGCGKSTQVPQYLLEFFLESRRGAEFNAYVSQPRRISAISLAERVAVERNEEFVGRRVGYGVRFDSVYPCPYGSIFFCTIGFLLKKMEKGLRGVSHVIIDEIHERDINTDFVLIVLREMAKEYPELRIVLMSATVDTTMFSRYFGGCPVIEVEGRSYPVERLFLEDIVRQLDYMPKELPTEPRKKNKSNGDDKNENLNILDKDADPTLQEAMSRIDENDVTYELIEKILLDIDAKGGDGAVLIFLPGWMEIMSLMDQLAAHSMFSNASKFIVLPLHSQLPGGELRKVFRFYGRGVRKIIVSTNIAETGLTIPDVVYVIDSCKVRETHHITEHNMMRYDTVWASRSNLAQRSGRAGRVCPGVCYQLCSRARFEALDEHLTAEMLRSPLISVALTIKSLRLGSVAEFLAKAIEPPPADAVEGAETELKDMGAFDDNSELTKLGRIIARLPVEAKVGKAIVLATSLGIGSLMCELAAASSLISPFIPSDPKDRCLNADQRSFAGNRWSDHAALIAVNQFFPRDMDEEEERDFCKQYSTSAPVLRSSADVKEQLKRSLVHRGFPEEVMTSVRADVKGSRVKLELLTSILVSACYPNIGFHRRWRAIRTLDQMGAQISKMSVLTPGKDENADVTFPSPLIIYSEKIKTRVIMCRELSLVSAVQLLLFGSRKVECVGENLIRLDNTILLKMDVDVAAALIALRPCVEKHLIKTCLVPHSLLEQTEADRELVAILYELSSSSLFAEAESKKTK